MKRTNWILLFFLLCTAGLSAQDVDDMAQSRSKYGPDSIECMKNVNIYYQLVKSKEYAEAFESWKYVYDNCPEVYENTFIFAPYIIQAHMKEVESEERKAELMDLLFESYDKRLEYFPEKKGYVLGQKALSTYKLRPDSLLQAHDLFMQAYELDSHQHSAAFFNYFFLTGAKLYNKKEFDIDQLLETYNIVTEAIETNNNKLNVTILELTEKSDTAELSLDEEKTLTRAEKELSRYEKVDGNIEKTLSPIMTCEKLEVIYSEESFEKHKEDAEWLRRAARMLAKERDNEEGGTEDCTDLPIFIKISDALYDLEPSPVAARSVARIAWKKENYERAIKYYKEAADREKDPKKAADDYFRAAAAYQKRGMLSQAKNYALKAANGHKGWGSPYILLATIYADAEGSCGDNVCEKKAVYWAAIDKLNYARSIDPEVRDKADKLINSYRSRLPDKTVCFQLGVKEGDQLTIGCWIDETVQVSF